MMALTDEEKRARKVQRVIDRFKTLRLFKCVNQTAALFQRLVRLRAIEPDGKLTCCSCGKRDYPGRHFDSGHWIGRTRKSVIFFDTDSISNCHPQCVECNRFGVGAVKAGYDDFMRKRYGQKAMDGLIRLSNEPKQWTKEELAEMYVGYQDDLKRLKENE